VMIVLSDGMADGRMITHRTQRLAPVTTTSPESRRRARSAPFVRCELRR
jgi:hypothetical protein